MNPVKRRLVLAGIISLSIVAAACGSDSKSSSTTAAPTTLPALRATTAAGDVTTTEAAASPTTAAATPTTMGATVDFSKLTGNLVGSGATFPKSFYDQAIADLDGIAPGLTVEYGGGGSGQGQTDLQEMTKDFVGSDGVVKDADLPKYKGGEFVYVPTVIAPITLSYNLPWRRQAAALPGHSLGDLPAGRSRSGTTR